MFWGLCISFKHWPHKETSHAYFLMRKNKELLHPALHPLNFLNFFWLFPLGLEGTADCEAHLVSVLLTSWNRLKRKSTSYFLEFLQRDFKFQLKEGIVFLSFCLLVGFFLLFHTSFRCRIGSGRFRKISTSGFVHWICCTHPLPSGWKKVLAYLFCYSGARMDSTAVLHTFVCLKLVSKIMSSVLSESYSIPKFRKTILQKLKMRWTQFTFKCNDYLL